MQFKRTFLFLPAAVALTALILSDFPATEQARAGNLTHYTKRGNWKSSGRITGQRPKFERRLRSRQPTRFDFYEMFEFDPLRPRGNWFATDGARADAPTLIAPDAPVTEYVEKPKIYVYPAPELLPLRAADLGAETEGADDTPLARAIRDVLRTGAARVEVEPAHRKAIIAFYKARAFAPLWVSGSDVSSRAQSVLALLARAEEHGLKPEHYRVPVVWEHYGDAGAIAGNDLNLARLDVELTALALRYARHLSGGVVDPNKLSGYHDLKPPKIPAPKALQKLAQAEDVVGWLQSLAPTHFAYGLMKRELARLRDSGPEKLLPAIPMGKLIRPGRRDERLPLIRQHLGKLGLLPAHDAQAGTEPVILEPASASAEDRAGINGDKAYDPPAQVISATPASMAVARSGPADPTLYDEELVRAVREFQRLAGLKPDGLIGRGTIRALNERNSRSTRKERMEKLALNMERLRWMPRDFDNPHFLVNVPAFEVYMYENGKQVWKSRVIVGKPKNQTYFFSDHIEYVVFNPYWGVPQSIIRKEFIPKLIKDPYWLDREGYEVRDSNGRIISSASVDWASWRHAKRIPFSIRQLPGDRNALGRIKVLFPNRHAIYMHDTPFKNLFKRSKRTFSHGCVRVQKPVELAELVSGLDPFEIENLLKTNRNKQIKLKRRIRVHIAYFTVWPDGSGKLRYYDDVYGRDRLLKIALDKHDAAYMRAAVRQVGLR